MTDVEQNSTARSGRMARGITFASGLVWTAVTVVVAVVIPVARPVGADQIGDAKAQAVQITAEIQADGQRLDQISQRYDAAQQRVQQIDQRIAQARVQLAQTRGHVHSDQSHLRRQALDAYMSGSNDTSLTTLFTSGGDKASAAAEYQNVATGNLTTAIDTLHSDERLLASQEAQLQVSQTQAQSALASVAADRQSAEAAQSAQEAALSQVKGKIATLVAQAQQAQQAAQHQAFLNRVAAAQAAAPANTGGGGGGGGGGFSGQVGGSPVPPSGSGGGAAVAAAESQEGVPYVWGGETPGVGFDCSGLTQWAWGRAGVSIPRTAQAQYYAIADVSLGALEPGDLLFWGTAGDIFHVAMYVGGGEVIQAPETGETVSIAPIWGSELFGAGRP